MAILATLTLTAEAREHTADELYAKLSPELREQINELDFRDFLDKCIKAGAADAGTAPDGSTQSFSLHGPDQFRFRVTFT